MKLYKGCYQADFTVLVTSPSRKLCSEAYNRFRNLVKAMNFGGIETKENEYTTDEIDAKTLKPFTMYRKQIFIRLVEHVEYVVIFREIMETIILNCNIDGTRGIPLSAKLTDCKIIPYYRTAEFFNDTL